MKYKRIFTIVLDSLGIGEMKDSASFGDIGVDTFGHIAEKNPNMAIPNLKMLGIGNLKKMTGIEPVEKPMARFMKLNEESNGKDTMTGHWEMMGLKTTKPFITFTDTGFPSDLIEELEKRTGHKVIGNKASSGTVILDELGEEHIKTGAMIVYTSADSVLQIAAHEKYFGLDELYRCCDIAREITMKPEWNVGRIIARPFLGEKKGEFTRTPNRHDIAVKPFGKTALNTLKDNGFDMISIGKINDIFVGEGVTEAIKSQSSVNGMEQTIEVAKDRDFTGLCFVNLVDFDAKWGHRRDPQGYAHEIEMFDEKLGELLKYIKEDDLIILTADHGNDPTYTGSDHTREQVPFIAYSPRMKNGKDLGEADTFAIIGATIVDNFGLGMPEGTIGTSYLNQLID